MKEIDTNGHFIGQEMLPSYNGALTEIICVTTVPSFLINGLYSSRHYNQLPDQFGIEARVAPDRNNVTLHINGSRIRVHNITVKCQNLIDSVTGQTETLFQFTLFNGKHFDQFLWAGLFFE